MVQRGEDLAFALKPHHAIDVRGEWLRQDLQRDVAAEPGITGPIDLAHAPGAEEAGNFVRSEASASSE